MRVMCSFKLDGIKAKEHQSILTTLGLFINFVENVVPSQQVI